MLARRLTCVAGMILFVQSLLGAPDAPEAIDHIDAQLANVLSEYQAAFKEARTPTERARLQNEVREQVNTLVTHMLDIAETNSQSATAGRAATWVVMKVDYGDARQRAFDVLKNHHVESLHLAPLCERLGVSPGLHPDEQAFLLAVFNHNPDRTTQGLACIALARTFEIKSKLLSSADADPALLERIAGTHGSATAEALKRLSRQDLDQEANMHFQTALEKFTDVPFRNGTIGDAAKARQQALLNQHAEIGTTATEIQGADLEGRQMNLSEFRGKVVVLTFWASWCGACLAQVPHENQLVEKHDPNRFVILGVNSDSDIASAQQAVHDHKISWRSWQDGWKEDSSTGGPISLQYHVDTWPTNYVIDRTGIIRHKNLSGKKLEEAVDALLNTSPPPQ